MKRLFSTALLIFSPWLCSHFMPTQFPCAQKLNFNRTKAHGQAIII